MSLFVVNAGVIDRNAQSEVKIKKNKKNKKKKQTDRDNTTRIGISKANTSQN